MLGKIVIGFLVICGIGWGISNISGTDTTSNDFKAKWNQVELGMSEEDVIGILGKPDDKQRTEAQGLGTLDCMYWGFADKQLCFTNGILDNKADY
ncbi:MAG TPA: hypothetical protein VH593_08615 [Ktedonobacteraceae bacterium]|jgi:hypothetical protein